jgi:presenilin-like A22 family membrane protease
MNLNKFSKAELISKLKEFKNNSENQSKLLNSFYIIKQFIVKFTLLALIIKIFKRFRILRRI